MPDVDRRVVCSEDLACPRESTDITQKMEYKKYLFFIDYYLALILIGSQLWSSSVCEPLPGYNIDTSPSVTVQRGLCVHVPCSFTVPSDVRLSISTTGIWFFVHKGVGYRVASKNNLVHQTFGQFYLTGNVSGGDCSYSIEDPQPIYETIYYFRVEDDPIKITYQDIQPHVNITDLTDKPIISSTRLVDGEEVTWTCTSPGRCRNITPQITWEGPITGIRQKMYDVTYGDGSRTFHSRVTFTPRKSHSNSPLFCRVTFKSGVTTVEERTLNVEYSPSVYITIEGVDTDDITAVNVKDGDSITMKCIVDSNPEASITWYKEDMEVHRTVTLTLINITLSDAGRYRCSAENEHGAVYRTVDIIHNNGESNHITHIILATIGTICLLLLALLAFACWRKKQKKVTSAEMEATYTDLRRSDITSIYDQLKPEIPADANVIGSDAGASNVYENIQKRNVLK